MSGAPHQIRATFWLIDASDSLARQSRREPDGTGLGVYDADGSPIVHKAPIAAYHDRAFAEDAREVQSTTFIAHIRYASTGALENDNTHPFEQDGRLFAHNGVIGDLEKLDAKLGEARSLVKGQTDSERFFALITAIARRNGGDLGRAITDAARYVAAELPLYALNIVLTTPTDIWALRYPETHGLYVLERRSGGSTGRRHLEAASAAATVRVRSGQLATQPAVVIASEPMDEDPGWREIPPGELVHVAADQTVIRKRILDRPPAHMLRLSDLDPTAARSQTHEATGEAQAPAASPSPR